ncbi:NYN domain-containing protein [Paracraurococcus lichenis]|uniref:NYN domain-containing protein n=1 Tax=Paracraurococcus lichenis TaxID=3064888 RepID=A0ABT9ECA1_9PROT|nr:NYN domain-containing protein [Paracraurococcus sp. LOR1-02]MDO9713848.1 NYN domain-containing protein [Paracraurococcus sp. LOR1-02]
MAEVTSDSARLAVLIDADNARPSVIEGLLAEVARYGVAGVRRAYGDWTTPNLAGWKAVLLDHSIQPVQQFRYTVGKNATDSAMIIDAMDLLHSRRLDGFCIVSSDSDFTGLARRIREDGLLVIGFGERKTPRPFVAACDRFVFTELLGPEAPGRETPVQETAKDLAADTRLVSLIRGAVEAASDDTGWASLGAVGRNIASQSPEFDARTYGYGKLSDLVAALPLFEVEERVQGAGPSKALYIRNRTKRAPRKSKARR